MWQALQGVRQTFGGWLDKFDVGGDAAYFRTVLDKEKEEIRSRRGVVTGSQPHGGNIAQSLAGIALSGGGIRSATFCLGVLQALQERGALRMFDYLSTVSGGGFVGGWWSAWLCRPDRPQGAAPDETFPRERIELDRETDYRSGAALDIKRGGELGAPVVKARPTAQDPVNHLRLYANYLTPRKGALSADTWRAAAVVTRNLLLTWLVLLPLLVAVLAVGQIYFLATPASAHGFVCASTPARDAPPACAVVSRQLDSLVDSRPEMADSVQAFTGREPAQARWERVRYALAPVLVFLGWLLVTTLVWILTSARDLPQLAGVVVGLAAVATLLHAVAERFTPKGELFHSPGGNPGPWVAIFLAGAGLIVLVGWVIPLVSDQRFLIGRGGDDRREVRTNRSTRIHAGLLAIAVCLALVLAVGGFAPDLFDFLFGFPGDQGAIARGVAQTGGWLAVLTAAAGTLTTLWTAAPAGGGDTKRQEPGAVRRALLAVTPVLMLLLLAVVAATALRYGLSRLPEPGLAARTPFFLLVPITLLVAAVAVGIRRLIARNSPNATDLNRVLWGLLVAFGGMAVAFELYLMARPLVELEPLGTSVLVTVLLAGFFALFEYLSDESATPRRTRVYIVFVATVAALGGGLWATLWSPLKWGTPATLQQARLPAAIFVGFTVGLVLARCSVGWTVERIDGKDQRVLRSRLAWLRSGRMARMAVWLSFLAGVVAWVLAALGLSFLPVPFDAAASVDEVRAGTQQFATFCVAALVFTSAFVVADLAWSRVDSRRALWLQMLTVGLLGPTLMQQFLNPLAPSVMFVNADLAFAAIALAIVLGLGWLVDPNTIALHTFYRARLVRAYLGASNSARTNKVSQAAQGDDLPLSSLENCRRGGPYHLINTTLNLVGGRDLVTAQRSAANFTLSARYCGSLRTGYRPTDDYMANQMTLGTALAISGAAASPNMGSKTPSAALAMWMAFLNVRLGYWAPTPHRPRWRSPQPRLWPFYLLSECLSQTNDLGSYCYLTDGGHFDNTGLYSLVERGCRYIVVVDCGADPRPCFSDIGDAVRRCRIDFDAEVELNVGPFGKGKRGFSDTHHVVGTIIYSKAHAERLGWGSDVDLEARAGVIVWLKPTRRPLDPVDVQQYALENQAFPQQTTGDQWFSEAQFESYRRLGLETGRDMLGSEQYQHPASPLEVEAFFKRVKQRYDESATPPRAPSDAADS